MKTYILYLGTFEKDEFVWKKLKEFDKYDAAVGAYKKFIREQLDYKVEELVDIWKSPRLDIEIKEHDVTTHKEEMLNWFGLYTKERKSDDEAVKDCSFGPDFKVQ